MRFREFKNEKSPRANAITDDPDAEIDESDVSDPLTAATDAADADLKVSASPPPPSLNLFHPLFSPECLISSGVFY